ncbi:bifunctional diguanylate cyclase/phosphodiesterase [Shewanella avicenniae]|uniref:Bifunctional diguanylate cyclase/phosphodiesterase n=1 Tax=Shewanella avicenniae TaxID=2814294 RepID=A0ABX7QU08_9GAMM|nr:bifunctional diguanylate cyclase/phosphodiesterase [Shewanella avicenniae]QSX34981.1 bifunctional diguanylate cyclase/phosphodiesterase [Shewanella avicenniae]
MAVDWIAYLAVGLGLLLLLSSIRPACRICQNDHATGWKWLVVLILFFCVGYSLFLLRLFYHPVNFTMGLLATILFFGAVFVATIIPQALKTILKIESIAMEERHNSLTDELTGLNNRKSMFEHLSVLSGVSKPFTLFFLDLNNFKQINDSLGHYYGDQFLRLVAERLNEVIPEKAMLFRIGGDEFAIVYRERSLEVLLTLVDSIHAKMLPPFVVHSHSMKSSASIGIACYPDHSNELFDLIKKADIAMYDCKQRQGNYTLYDQVIGAEAERKLRLSQQLSDAVRQNQFELYYQPIVDSVSNTTCCVEALLRWPQASGKVLLPEEFIPFASRSPLINAITYWVLNRVADDLPALRQMGFSHCIHINLSAKDLQNDNLVQQLGAMLQQGRLHASDIIFEITETDVVDDLQKAKVVMSKLNQMGFEFSVDDFGTGFSSLVLLRELPISQIKIDRSFVNNFLINDVSRAIVCHIIELATELNCSVVAEGVENSADAAELRRLGAELHQGWFYTEALPLAKLGQLSQQQAQNDTVMMVG